MKLRYYICALYHLFVLSGLFWHLQIIFDITGHILDSLKSTFITKLKDLFLVGNIKNDLVKYFMQHIRNGLIIDLINI